MELNEFIFNKATELEKEIRALNDIIGDLLEKGNPQVSFYSNKRTRLTCELNYLYKILGEWSERHCE